MDECNIQKSETWTYNKRLLISMGHRPGSKISSDNSESVGDNPPAEVSVS